MADENDPYFGFNTNSLEPGYVGVPYAPGYRPPGNLLIGNNFYYTDIQNSQNGQTGGQDDGGGGDVNAQIDGADIEVINKWIMGEQPGTTAERAQQWTNIAQLLQNTADTLREQTQTLAENWESPGAKDVFLSKVGETLAYLRVWQDAAIKNSVALHGLSNVMYEMQAEMRKLYSEYAGVVGALQYLADKPGVVAPNGMYVDMMPQRKVDEKVDEYNREARELAKRYVGEYAPYLAKLEAGRAKALNPPLNAIAHPTALGKDIPQLPPVAPPGAPGGTPPGGPGATPPGANPPGAPNANPPGTPNTQPPGTPPGDPTANPPTTTATPPAATPPGAPQLTPPGTPPGAPPATPPGATPPGVTGVPPAAFGGVPPMVTPFAYNGGGKTAPNPFSANTLAPGLFDGSRTPPATPPTLGDTSANKALGAPPGGLPPSFSQNSLYPPGTITPPPGGQAPQAPQEKAPGENQPGIPSYGSQSFTDHLEMEAKAIAQETAAATPPPPLPPGTSMPNTRDVEKATPASAFADGGYTEQAPAFQPPPTTAPPVLGNDTKRTQRGGSRTEAPATPPGGLGLGAPPVLSNPHRKAPEKTFTEKQRERTRAKRPVLPGMPGSEFAANLPASTTPVFDGRLSAEEYVAASAGEIPDFLQAPTPVVAAPDRHAKPVVHADRAQRVVRKDEKAPVADQAAFEVETPGGPVVAAGEREKRYRPSEPSALDGRN